MIIAIVVAGQWAQQWWARGLAAHGGGGAWSLRRRSAAGLGATSLVVGEGNGTNSQVGIFRPGCGSGVQKIGAWIGGSGSGPGQPGGQYGPGHGNGCGCGELVEFCFSLVSISRGGDGGGRGQFQPGAL